MEGRGRWQGGGSEERTRRIGTRMRGVQSGGERKGEREAAPRTPVCACVACERVCVKNGESRRKAKSTGGGSVRGGHESGDEEPPWLVRSTGGMRMNAGCKRESIRKGNRWMGLAAYPANAPSDIAVTWT